MTALSTSSSIVFHPDLPIPAPTVAGGRRVSLSDVAAHGAAASARCGDFAAAGGIYVCLGGGQGGAGGRKGLSEPRLCHLAFDMGTHDSGSGDGAAINAAAGNQFAHLPAYASLSKAVSGRKNGPTLTITTMGGAKESSGVSQQRRAASPRSTYGANKADVDGADAEGGPYEFNPPSMTSVASTTRRSGRDTPPLSSSTRPAFNASTVVDTHQNANSGRVSRNATPTAAASRQRATSANRAKSPAVGMPGMRTAARAASRARQDAQMRDVALPDEGTLKASKREYLSGLQGGSTGSSAAGGVYTARPSSSAPRPTSPTAKGSAAKPSSATPPPPQQRITFSLPCQRATLNETSILLKPLSMRVEEGAGSSISSTAATSHSSSDVLLTFTSADTFAAFVSLLETVESREHPSAVSGRMTPYATAAIEAAAVGEWGAAPAEFAADSSDYHGPRPPSGGGAGGGGSFLSSSSAAHVTSPSAVLRERFTEARLRHIGNDRRPLSPRRGAGGGGGAPDGLVDEWTNSMHRRDESIINGLDHSHAYGRAGLLGPAGRDANVVTDVVTDASMAAMPLTLSTQLTPAQRRERHWQVQAGFDRAREAFVRFEEGRRRDVHRLFEERDRRREAFLRKRSMLREEVVVPPEVLLTLQGMDPTTLQHADGPAPHLPPHQHLSNARDANWEAFAFMADTLGRKWEHGEAPNVDNLMMPPGGPSNMYVDPTAALHPPMLAMDPAYSSPPRQMSPDAVMMMAMGGGVGGAGSVPPPVVPSNAYLRQYAPDLAALMDAEAEGSAVPIGHKIPPMGFGTVTPVAGPASAALNSYFQHPLAHQGIMGMPAPHQQGDAVSLLGARPAVSDAGEPHYHRSASAATTDAAATSGAGGAMSALDRLRASRQNSMQRGVSVAATNLGGAAPAAGSVAPVAPQGDEASDDPLQAALRAEARLLKTVHTRLPSAPLPPLPPPKPATPVTEAAPSAEAAEVAAEERAAPVAPPPPKKAPPPPPKKSVAPPPAAPTAAPATAASPAPAEEEGPLPDGWKQGKADDGRTFYWNAATKERSWKRPTGAASPSSAAPAAAATPTTPSAVEPLAPGWKEVPNPKTGEPYYYNTATRETTKVRPTAASAGKAPAAAGGKAPPPPPAGGASPLPAGWKEVKAPDGRTYYYNSATKERSWTAPK